MSKEKITIGIDLGSHNVKVLVVRFAEEASVQGVKKISQVLATGIAPSQGMRRGQIEDSHELGACLAQAVRNAEKASGLSIRRAVVSVGNAGMKSFTSNGSAIIAKADLEVTDLDIAKVHDAAEDAIPPSLIQNRRIIHRTPISFKIDGEPVFAGRAIGMKGSKLETKDLYVVCLEPHLGLLARTVEDNDVEILDIVASPVAASLGTISKSQKIAGCVLLDIGAETTSLIVYEDNVPISVEILPLGGQDITNDIALGLKISIEEAESIKIGAMTASNISRKKLDEIIEARLSDIFELVEAHLKKISRNAMLPAGVFLTGGGAKILGIEAMAREALKLPAKVVSVSTGEKGKVLEPMWSVAYGLCLYGASNQEFSNAGSSGAGFKQMRNSVVRWFKQFLP